MTAATPVVWHLGPRSAALAEQLATSLGAAEICGPASPELVAAFTAGRPIVVPAAAGIIVRHDPDTAPAFALHSGGSRR